MAIINLRFVQTMQLCVSCKYEWKDNIKMDLKNVGWGSMDWITLTQDRGRLRALVNAVMNLWFPQNAGKFVTSSGAVCISGRTVLHWSYMNLPLNSENISI
jgi:hypothetical protein